MGGGIISGPRLVFWLAPKVARMCHTNTHSEPPEDVINLLSRQIQLTKFDESDGPGQGGVCIFPPPDWRHSSADQPSRLATRRRPPHSGQTQVWLLSEYDTRTWQEQTLGSDREPKEASQASRQPARKPTCVKMTRHFSPSHKFDICHPSTYRRPTNISMAPLPALF